ncbi:hypothetical protein BGX30_000442, partial [Mortierella sp. GBA39]
LIQGRSVRQVAKSVGISIGAAVNIRKNNKENIPPPKVGRQAKISQRTKEVLAREFKTGQLTTLHEGQQFVQAMDGVQVHVETVRKNLQQKGIRVYVQQRKPDDLNRIMCGIGMNSHRSTRTGQWMTGSGSCSLMRA